MTIQKFKLKLTAAGRGSTVEMNGQPLRNVRAVSVHTSVTDVTKVVLEFVNVDVDVEADAELAKIARLAAEHGS